MTTPISENTKATLLLTGHFLLDGKRAPTIKPLAPAAYSKLASRLKELGKSPSDLITKEVDAILPALGPLFDADHLSALLGRGLMMSEALDQWVSRGISIAGRSDAHYPDMLKNRLKALSPPIVFACGNWDLAERGGLSVVGSRKLPDTLLALTEQTGRLAAEAQIQIVSGGAKGVDQSAMLAALSSGGTAIGFLAEDLWARSISKDYRTALREGRLLLLSAVDPRARFNVGNAMQRNKFIYALSSTSLIINSDDHSGGTWSGAEEQLKRFHFTSLYTLDHPDCSAGNLALRTELAAATWPGPGSADELQDIHQREIIHHSPDESTTPPTPSPAPEQPASTAAAAPPDTFTGDTTGDTTAATPAPPSSDSPVVPELPAALPAMDPTQSLYQAAVLAIRDICSTPTTPADLGKALGIHKTQLSHWLKKMIGENLISKLVKPTRYLATPTVVTPPPPTPAEGSLAPASSPDITPPASSQNTPASAALQGELPL